MPVLEVEDLHSFYGLSHIVRGVFLHLNKGEIVCLLGRNGMGKTTTIRSIMGLNHTRNGVVKFKGVPIQNKPVYEIANLGIAYVPQGRGIFPDLTVHEHLATFSKKLEKEKKRENIKRIYNFFPKLETLRGRKGRFLSGGEQQMLAIARALVRCPDLVLLDEPSEGLAPVVLEDIQRFIGELKADGQTMLIAEQNLRFALEISDRGYIIEKGQIRLEDTSSGLKDNDVARKYLTAQ